MTSVRVWNDGAPLPFSSVLAVVAHPDDAESWCAGTLARIACAGGRVVLVVCTSGEGGPGLPATEAAATREREQLAAAARLGVEHVAFLRLPDGGLEDTPALRSSIAAAIRRYRPDLLITHDPERPLPRYFCHRDHRVAGRAALDAAYPLARDAACYVEGLPPHVVREAWLFASTDPDLWVDITGTLERKIEARLAHSSQTPDPTALSSHWRERFAETGAAAALQHAEAFAAVSAPDA